jgi:hypothetical protein
MLKIKINKQSPNATVVDEEIELTQQQRDDLVQKVVDDATEGSDEDKDKFLAKNLEEAIKRYIVQLLSR